MFKIIIINGSTSIEIHNDVNPTKELKVLSPKLDLSENNAGSFTAKIPPTNPGYGTNENPILIRMVTRFKIYRNNKLFWKGRLLSVKEDFYRNKSITCEGVLAYLNDTTMPQDVYEGYSTSQFTQVLLDAHNEKVEDYKKIYAGNLEIASEEDDYITNYETPIKLLSDKIISKFKGYFQIRFDNDKNYLDYIKDDDRPTCSQKIEFGTNLLDFTKSYDSTDFCTVIIPLGKRLQDVAGTPASGIEGISAYLTVEEYNDGSIYVINEEALQTYGRIEKIVKWEDCDDPEELLQKAQDYLKDVQFDKMSLEVNAVDLGYMKVDVDNIELSQNVRVTSKVHGLDKLFPVTKISIPLDSPGNTTFTMGDTAANGLSDKTNAAEGKIEDIINENDPDINQRFETFLNEILGQAKKNAASLIESCTTGFFTIVERTPNQDSHYLPWNEVYITDYPIKANYDHDFPVADTNIRKYWRWNMNGLAFFDKDQQGKYGWDDREDLRFAITMNGEICANYITVGELNAFLIKAGRIQGDPRTTTYNNWWDMQTGEFHIESGGTFIKKEDGTTVTFHSWMESTDSGIKGALDKAVETSDSFTEFTNQYEVDAEGFRVSLNEKYDAADFSTDFSNYFNISARGIVQDLEAIEETIEDDVVMRNDFNSYFEYTAKNLTLNFSQTGTNSTFYSLLDATAKGLTYTVKQGSGASSDSFYSQFRQAADAITFSIGTPDSGYESATILSELGVFKERISLKVGIDNIASAIEMTPDTIYFSAGGEDGHGKIIIEGGNFSVNGNGFLTCYGANIWGNLTTGGTPNDDDYLYLTGHHIYGYRGSRECKIDFNGSMWDGDVEQTGVLTLIGGGISLSTNEIFVTEYEGQTQNIVSGVDLNKSGWKFIHGICINASLPDTVIDDTDFWSLNSNGFMFKHKFKNGYLVETDFNNYSHVREKLGGAEGETVIRGQLGSHSWTAKFQDGILVEFIP